MANTVNVAIIGFGVVGSGVAEILSQNPDSIQKTTGKEVKLKHILVRKDPDQNSPYLNLFTKDWNTILNDSDVDIVVESIGGLGPAYDMTKQALSKGKSVVTPNKELVATHGAELFSLAKENNCNYLFEASVAGGIPVLRPLTNCLGGNHKTDIKGILNGTTNYILTRMIEAGLSFDTALKEAQDLGFAEKDPTADVDGHDACRKICILADIAYGSQIDPKTVSTTGIRNITLEDVAYAESQNYSIKLLGRSYKDEKGEIAIYVAPHFVPNSSPLHGVKDVFNAVSITGDMVGETMFYGKGAGKLPTASAVIADIIDLASDLHRFRNNNWAETSPTLKTNSGDNSKSPYYLRAKEQSGLQDKFKNAQTLTYNSAPKGEIALLTEPLLNSEFQALCQDLTVIHSLKVLEPLQT